MEQIETWNRAFFLKINATHDTSIRLIDAAMFMANYFIYLVPILLLSLWLWGGDKKRNVALKACVVALLALGINQLIGLLWQHLRPFILGLSETWLPHVADSSFPSDHVTVLASISISFLLEFEISLGMITALIGLCVGWARGFLGVNFPLAIVGAIAVSVCAYLIAYPIWNKIGHTLTNYMQSLYRIALVRPIAQGWIRQ